MSTPITKEERKLIIFGAGTEDPRNIIAGGDLPDGVEKFGNQSKFRVDAKRLFITYPKCLLSKEKLLEEILKIVGEKNIQLIEICKENHEDGTPHLHMIMILKRKYNCRDCRWLDIEGYHPNIGGIKKIIASKNYIRKHDLNVLTWGNQEDPFDGPEGFCRKKEDWDAWNTYNENKRLKVWTGEFNCFGLTGGNINTKQRHIWIVGDPNIGKTQWINDTFEGYKVYCPQKDSDYRFDDYTDENIIIYDDIIPKLAELIDVSNVYKIRTPVFGKTRYTKKYWPLKEIRTIIIMTNIKPTYWEDTAFNCRFNKIDLRKQPFGREELRNNIWEN